MNKSIFTDYIFRILLNKVTIEISLIDRLDVNKLPLNCAVISVISISSHRVITVNDVCQFTFGKVKTSIFPTRLVNKNCNEMSFRGRVLGLVEVVLRVPPLFVIDEILKIGLLGIPYFVEHDLSNIEEKYAKIRTDGNLTTNSEPYDPMAYTIIFTSIFRLFISTLGMYV